MKRAKKAPRRPRSVCVSCPPSFTHGVFGLDTGRRWEGWIVPWFSDDAMNSIAAALAAEGEAVKLEQQVGGGWLYTDEGGDSTELPRVRRWGGAYTDSAEMAWCWCETDSGGEA